jgi:hypothetical protein
MPDRWVPCNVPVRTKLCHKIHKRVGKQWYGVIEVKRPNQDYRKKGKKDK